MAATSYQVDAAGSNLGDSVDVFVWTGHSWLPADPGWGGPADRDKGACLHFISQHDKNCICGCAAPHSGRDCGNINHKECRFGAGDNEVAIFVTCEWLRNLNDPNLITSVRCMQQGSHLILSFAGDAWFDGDGHRMSDWGDALGLMLVGHAPDVDPVPIWEAWLDACHAMVPESSLPRVQYWGGDCLGDYLVGNWVGYGMGAPPPAYSCYIADQFKWRTG
jgi:hypothetical protein